MDSIDKVELTVAEKLAQMEKEKLTRRQALARFGFQAGAVAVAALTADDLLRAVGKEMQQRAGDNKVAQKVAKELQSAGVANAAAYRDCTTYPSQPQCESCCALHYTWDVNACGPPPCDIFGTCCNSNGTSGWWFCAAYNQCIAVAKTNKGYCTTACANI